MTSETKILPTIATTPPRLRDEAEDALRQIATILADRASTTEQIMGALREWSRVVMARRDGIVAPEATVAARQPSVPGIVDVVSLSSAALARRAS